MANIIYGEIKEVIENDLAIIRVRSYGLENNFNFEERDELTIRFSNINKNCSIENLVGECLEIIIFEDSINLNEALNGTGRVMRVISSKIFYL